MSTIFRTLIVPDSCVEAARTIAAGLEPVSGQNMWTTGLSPTGQGQPTHWISTGLMGSEWGPILPLTEWAWEDGQWMLVSDDPGQPAALFGMCQQLGIPITQPELNDVFDLADVTFQEPFVAMERLGIRIIDEQ